MKAILVSLSIVLLSLNTLSAETTKELIVAMETRIAALGVIPGSYDNQPIRGAVDESTGLPNLRLPMTRLMHLSVALDDNKTRDRIAAKANIYEIYDFKYMNLAPASEATDDKFYAILLGLQLEDLGFEDANIDPRTGLPNLNLGN